MMTSPTAETLLLLRQSKHLLSAVALAPTCCDRQKALAFALTAFEEVDESTKQVLCRSGAVKLLTQCLRKELYNENMSTLKIRKQLCLLILDLISGVPEEATIHVIRSAGADLVSTLLSSICYSEMNGGSIPGAYKILQLFADCQVPICTIERKEILIRSVHLMIGPAVGSLSIDLLSILYMLLATWSEDRTSRRFLVVRPGMIDDIVDSAASKHTSVKQTCFLARCIHNLLLDPLCRRDLVHKKSFLEVLSSLFSSENHEVQRFVLGAWANISIDARCRHKLLKSNIRPVTLEVCLALESQDLQGVALRLLLRILDATTAPKLLKERDNLVVKLFEIAVDAESEEEVSALAAKNLLKLSHYVSVKDTCHTDLLEALISISASTSRDHRLSGARAFSCQCSHSTSAFYIARSPHIIESIVGLSRAPDESIRAVATEGLLALVSHTANSKWCAKSSIILETLVENANACNSSTSYGRRSVHAILTLVDCESAQKRLAKQIQLVACLSRYGASNDPDHELRRAALHGVLLLAPLM